MKAAGLAPLVFFTLVSGCNVQTELRSLYACFRSSIVPFVVGFVVGGLLVFAVMRRLAKLFRQEATDAAYMQERALSELHIALGVKKGSNQRLN